MPTIENTVGAPGLAQSFRFRASQTPYIEVNGGGLDV